MRITQTHVLFFTKRDWPSNWHAAPFGPYACGEQAFMARKARFFDDGAALAAIMADPDPAHQKALGRNVRGFDKAAWDAASPRAMYDVQVERYGHDAQARERLVALSDKRFVEASPYDRIWGTGLGIDHPHADDPARWPGRNLLGRAIDAAAALMRERTLRARRGLAPAPGDADAFWEASQVYA